MWGKEETKDFWAIFCNSTDETCAIFDFLLDTRIIYISGWVKPAKFAS